jgi:subtilisin family serine protease
MNGDDRLPGTPLQRESVPQNASPRDAFPPLGCAAAMGAAGAAAWILFVSLVIQTPAWFSEGLNSGAGQSGLTWLGLTWGNLALIALLTVPVSLVIRRPALKQVFRAWSLAAGVSAVVGLARLIGRFEVQTGMLAQAGLALTASAALLLVARAGARRGPPAVGPTEPAGRRIHGRPAHLFAAALFVGLAAALPSLAWGALGSPYDALAGLLNGLAFGVAAASLLAGVLFDAGVRRLPHTTPTARRSFAFDAFSAGVLLFILSLGFGWRGSELLLLIALPPLGIAAAAVATEALATAGRPRARRWSSFAPLALLAGLPAAALTMFWDPEELTVLLGAADIPTWAFRAACVSLLIAAGAGLVLRPLRLIRSASPLDPSLSPDVDAPGEPEPDRAISPARAARPFRGVVLPGLAALMLVASAALYFFAGHPGFYGEGIFVILRDQADVSSASKIADRTQRLSYVYSTLTQHAERSQSALWGELDRIGVHYHPYYLVNSLEVTASPTLRQYLAGRPEVARILDSPHLRPLPQPAPAARGSDQPVSGPGWNIRAIGADRVWNELGVTGQGIIVGQSDSGVQGDHPALVDGYRGKGGQNDYNWLDPWNGSTRPVDFDGHGTHTLGTALGRGGIGVAPGAQWIGCVNLARNLGNPGVYLNCMQFMLAPYPQNGDAFLDGVPARAAHVLNDSWGCPLVEGCDASVFAPAMAALKAAGIYVVASAGNDGPACASVTDPIALYGDVLTVGAIDQEGNLTDFSSRGPVQVDGSGRTKPDIVAPGQDVLSAFPGDTYSILAGTSMSGPHLVGVVALMWSAQPRLIGDIDRTTQILQQTARPYTGTLDSCAPGATRPNNDAGYGVVDAYAAVKAAQNLP